MTTEKNCAGYISMAEATKIENAIYGAFNAYNSKLGPIMKIEKIFSRSMDQVGIPQTKISRLLISAYEFNGKIPRRNFETILGDFLNDKSEKEKDKIYQWVIASYDEAIDGHSFEELAAENYPEGTDKTNPRTWSR